MRLTTTMKAGTAIAACALLLSGCLASSTTTKGNKGANTNTSSTIHFTVAFSGAQFTNFQKSVDPYAKSQGITIKWASDPNFNTDIVNDVKAGNVPDIAMFPQPGILRQLAAQGKLADLSTILDISKLKSEMVADISDPGTYNGKVYGLPPSINVKSLIFYPKKTFAADHLTIPNTTAGLLAFAQKLKSEGKTPWCMGIESGSATGWPATDWIEQMVLDYGGLTQYNNWITHKVLFSSPLVTKAAEYFQTMFSTPGFVDGGQSSIASSNFATAGNPMFNANNTESSPGCYMYKQGSFVVAPGFFPKQILANVDSDLGVAPFPGVTANSQPVEGGGDVAGLFSGKNKNAIKIMKYMLSPTFGAYAAKNDTLISPFKNYNQANYSSDVYRSMANVAYHATTFAFDASDNMPGAVGSGSFWTQMTQWISGKTSLQSALKAIDASWPTS